MVRAGIWTAVVLGTILLASGCDEPPTGVRDGSFFRAEVSGSLSLSFEGPANFWAETPREGVRPFNLSARGTGGHARYGFNWHRLEDGVPSVGTRLLRLRHPKSAAREGWFVLLDSETGQRFIADSGSVHVTHSSGKRLEGAFEFAAFQYCPRPGGSLHCPMPLETDSPAPRIRVTGSFVAVPPRDVIAVDN